MKMFEPKDPLLKSIQESIQRREDDFFYCQAQRYHRGEGTHALWFPVIQHGCLAHDSEKDTWEQLAPSDGNENLIIYFRSDGFTYFQQGDDDVVYLQTTLRAGDEVHELLEFYETAQADAIGGSARVLRPLKSLFEDVARVADELFDLDIFMSVPTLCKLLNELGYRANDGSEFSGGRGSYRLVSRTYHHMANSGQDDRAHRVAVAFRRPNFEYAYPAG